VILLQLFIAFIRIGAFSFGGGYAMIPLIAAEVERFRWIDTKTFADVIAIAEMTPGPIAVNLATFVGYQTAGLAGSTVATFGVVLPSLVLIILVGGWLRRMQGNRLKDAVFAGIRPVVAGLIASAVYVVGKGTLVVAGNAVGGSPVIRLPGIAFDLPSLLIALACLFVLLKSKLHPGAVILGAAAAGILTGFVVPGFGG
jgi:chromate transporter